MNTDHIDHAALAQSRCRRSAEHARRAQQAARELEPLADRVDAIEDARISADTAHWHAFKAQVPVRLLSAIERAWRILGRAAEPARSDIAEQRLRVAAELLEETVATLAEWHARQLAGNKPKPDVQALADAAPALLQALGRVEAFLSRCEGNGGSTEGQNTSLGDEIAAARAALAKAKGGQQ